MSYYPVAPLPDVNARQVAQVIRPSSTSLLTIDSEDRFANYLEADAAIGLNPTILNVSPYDFTIRKAESLMNGFFTRIGISEVNFPWAIPNINQISQTVDVAYKFQGGAETVETVIMPVGFYTPHEIAAYIQEAVRNLTGIVGFTMSYGKDEVGNGAAGNPSFSYATNDADYQVAFRRITGPSTPPSQKQLFNLLGFSALNSNFQLAAYGAYTYCQYTRYVDICCFQLTNNQALKDQTSQTIARDALCRIYLGDALIPGNIPVRILDSVGANIPNPAFCPPGCAPTTIYRNFTTPKQIQWIPNQPVPGFLRFSLFDDTGTSLTKTVEFTDYATGVFLDWSMTMLVSEN